MTKTVYYLIPIDIYTQQYLQPAGIFLIISQASLNGLYTPKAKNKKTFKLL